MSILLKLFNKKERSKNLEDREGKEVFLEEADEGSEEEVEKSSEVVSKRYNNSEDKEYYSSVNVDKEIEYEVVEREILPTKIICPDCGGITLEGLDFCDKCGGELL